MSYINGTKKNCNGNTNGYIYALVRVHKKDACVDMISYSEDKEFYLNDEHVKYIGTTNNPVSRFQSHRIGKGKKIGMVIFDEADSPAEGKMKEAQAIYNYCETMGKGPSYQKGHDTWSGA
tara:strand:+ start:40 stop:399 length:360 start_codon:yes stop_codon:yes gene_type:complete